MGGNTYLWKKKKDKKPKFVKIDKDNCRVQAVSDKGIVYVTCDGTLWVYSISEDLWELGDEKYNYAQVRLSNKLSSPLWCVGYDKKVWHSPRGIWEYVTDEVKTFEVSDI